MNNEELATSPEMEEQVDEEENQEEGVVGTRAGKKKMLNVFSSRGIKKPVPYSRDYL